MEENSSVSEHILRMSGYNNHLIQLGVNLPDDSVIDRILQSLPPSYKSFVMNYNMQGMNKTIPELFAMLKAAEVEIKMEHQVLMVNKTTSFKKKGKGKKKGNFKKNSKQVVVQEKKPRFNLGFLHWSGNWFAIHEVSLLALALLETSGLVKPSTLDAPF